MALTVAELKAVFSADTSGLARGDRAVQESARNAKRAYEQTGDSIGRTSSRSAGLVSSMRSHFVALAGAGAIGAVIKSSSVLEQKYSRTMNLVAAATGAPASQMKRLDALAMKLGADTQFSANDAAEAMLELGKAGISTSDIYGGALKGTLLLAAAGGTDLGTAATIASNAMNTFNLHGADMNKIASALAGGANASSASVESLGQALQQVGPGAKNAGLSLNETIAALSAFDAAGIKGSDAGTSLKTMLMNLVPQTKQAKTAMADLGLDFVNADGSFKSLANISQQLHDKLGPLTQAQRTQALTTIFGSDASRAASVLMNQGAKGIEKYIRATQDQGAAQKMANAAMHGTAGAMERLRGSVETAELALGKALAPTIREVAGWLSEKALPAVTRFIGEMQSGKGAGGDFADTLRSAVDAGKGLVHLGGDLVHLFSSLPGPVKKYGIEAAIAAGALSKLVNAGKGLRTLGTVGGLLKGGGLGAAAGGAVASSRPVPVFVTNEGFGAGGGKAAGAGAGVGAAAGAKGPTLLRALGTLAIEAAVVDIGGHAAAPLLKHMADWGGGGKPSGGMYAGFDKTDKRPGPAALTGNAHTLAADAKTVLNATKPVDGFLQGLGQSITKTFTGLDAHTTVSKKNIAALDSRLAAMNFQHPAQGAKAFGDVLKKSGLSTEQLNKVLPKTATAMKTVHEAAQRSDLAKLLHVGGVEAAASAVKVRTLATATAGLPKRVRTDIVANGIPKTQGQIAALQRKYDLTPKQVRTLAQLKDLTPPQMARVRAALKKLGGQKATPRVIAQIAQAIGALGAVRNSLASLHDKTITVAVRRANLGASGIGPGAVLGAGHATGGRIAGPGSGTSDDVPAMLSNGEYVIRAAAAKRYGYGFLDELNAERYASGGKVKKKKAPAAPAPPPAVYHPVTLPAGASGSLVDVLQTLKDIGDYQAQLTEHAFKQVGKGKNAHQVDVGLKVQGLDRQLLQAQMAEEWQKYSQLIGPDPSIAQDAAQERADQMKQMADSMMGGGIFTSGATSVSSLLKSMTKQGQVNQQYATVLAQLSGSGLSKDLLDQFEAQGPSAQAIRLGQSILKSGAVGQLNAAQAALTGQANQASAWGNGQAATPVEAGPAVNIEHFDAGGMDVNEVGERFYYLSQVRK